MFAKHDWLHHRLITSRHPSYRRNEVKSRGSAKLVPRVVTSKNPWRSLRHSPARPIIHGPPISREGLFPITAHTRLPPFPNPFARERMSRGEGSTFRFRRFFAHSFSPSRRSTKPVRHVSLLQVPSRYSTKLLSRQWTKLKKRWLKQVKMQSILPIMHKLISV